MSIDYNKLGVICELFRSWLPNYEIRIMFELEYVKLMFVGDTVYNFTIMNDYLNSHSADEIAEYVYDKIAINVK